MKKIYKTAFIFILCLCVAGCDRNYETGKMQDTNALSRLCDSKNEMQNVQNILSEIKYDGVSVIGEAAFCKTENITVRKREIYAPNVSSDEIPKEKEIVYFNRLTGRDETVTGRLVQIGEEQSAVWEDTITGEIIFQTADENGDEWIMPDGRHVSMKIDTDIPNWDTMTEDLPILTGIKSENYTLSGIEWSGDIYESEGQWKRNAVYTLKRSQKGKYAIYECNVKGIKESGDTKLIKADTTLLHDYRETNKDVLGIIRIPGTGLNHPVMKSDNEGFYLWHDLNGNYNSHGVPFISGDGELAEGFGNRIIYGHRLNDKDVFGELPEYENPDFYKTHPIIETVSDEGTARWLITAYFLVNNSDEETFEYYLSGNFVSKEEYDKYMYEVEKRNWINVPYEYSIWDSFITLSTCSKERTGGRSNRLVIMAVQIPYDMKVEDIVLQTKYNESPLLPEKMR